MSDDDDKDDRELFRRAVADARPIKSNRHEPARPLPRPVAKFAHRDEHEVMKESLGIDPEHAGLEFGDELFFRRSGVRDRVLRKLRRGAYTIEAELDLHGLTVEGAREALHGFLLVAARRRLGCVRVVHGKGLGSGPRGPVLKNKVDRWLRRRTEVLAFVSARPAQGGTGAVCVLLKN